jgi:hypothetical protein
MVGIRDAEESMEDHPAVLRKQSTSGRSSVIELDEVAIYPNVLTPRTSREVTDSFDLGNAASTRGPLDSHPPSPQFPPAIASNTWRAPEEWAVPVSKVDMIKTIGVLPDAMASAETLSRVCHTQEKTVKMDVRDIGIAK